MTDTERHRYVIVARTIWDAARVASAWSLWLHSWDWVEADCEPGLASRWPEVGNIAPGARTDAPPAPDFCGTT